MKAKVMLGISVAAMLKDCPEGMPLYSTLCGPCKLVNVDYDGTPNDRLIIQVEDRKKNRLFFTDEGKYMNSGDVVLFPNKNCKPTDWELFVMGRLHDGEDNNAKEPYRPFRNGDECWREMNRHEPFGWVIIDCGAYPDIRTTISTVYFDGTIEPTDRHSYIPEEALRTIRFEDGTPFGIKTTD